jgi:D-sedoheptulose 7-phosphate isomerase
MKEFCDILINVPEKRTALVQELHLPVYHTLCLMVESHFFGNDNH